MLPNDAPVPLKFAPDTPVLLSFFARANQNCGSGIRYVFSLWASPWVTRTRGCPRPDVSRIRLPPIASSAPRSFAWLTCCPPSGAPGRRSPGNTMRRRFPPRGALAALPLLLLVSLPLASSARAAAAAVVVIFRAREGASSRGFVARSSNAPSRRLPPLAPATTASIPARRCTPSRPGRIGAIGDPHSPNFAFERWVLDATPRGRRVGPPRPRPIGPLKLRAVWGRGRVNVTTRPVEAGETLMRVRVGGNVSPPPPQRPLPIARKPPASSPAGSWSEQLVVALHLLHELYVQGAASPWCVVRRILPADVGSPVMWAPRELAGDGGPARSGHGHRRGQRPWRTEWTRSSPRSPSGIPSSSPNNTFARRGGCGAMSRCGLGRRTCPRGTDEPSSRWFRCSTCSITDTIAGTGRPMRTAASGRDGMHTPVRSWCGPRRVPPGRDTRRGSSSTAINPRSTRSCSTVSCR